MPQNDNCQKKHWFERIFGALSESARKDIKTFIIVLLTISNAFFISKWTSCTEVRVTDKKAQYDEILRLLLPRIEEITDQKVDQKTKYVIENVEKVDKTLNELTKAVKDKVKEISK